MFIMPTTPFLKEKIEDCRLMYYLGGTCNDLIEVLHDQGLSMNEVCQVVAAVLDIEPTEAQIFVADHPIWTEVVENNSPVGDEVKKVLDRDGTVDDLGGGVLVFREVLADAKLVGPNTGLAFPHAN
jgi:hypothetical protein